MGCRDRHHILGGDSGIYQRKTGHPFFFYLSVRICERVKTDLKFVERSSIVWNGFSGVIHSYLLESVTTLIMHLYVVIVKSKASTNRYIKAENLSLYCHDRLSTASWVSIQLERLTGTQWWRYFILYSFILRSYKECKMKEKDSGYKEKSVKSNLNMKRIFSAMLFNFLSFTLYWLICFVVLIAHFKKNCSNLKKKNYILSKCLLKKIFFCNCYF